MPKAKAALEHSGRQVTCVKLSDLQPHQSNPRIHPATQVRAIAASIEAFGFNAPILVNKNNQIVAGHGRFAAMKLLGHTQVEIIRLEHLSDVQSRAYMLADNKLTDRSLWDECALGAQLKELSELALDFDLEAIGFEQPEIDLLIQSLDDTDADAADDFEVPGRPAVSTLGEL